MEKAAWQLGARGGGEDSVRRGGRGRAGRARPRHLRVAARSSTQLQVSWDEPDPALCHGAILRYNLGYKEFGLKTPFPFFDLDRYEWDRTRFQFLVRRLQQHTKYEVVVQAVNTHGEGPLSPVTVAQTREAAPEAA